MKKILFSLFLITLNLNLFARPYIYQYHGHGRILIFQGNIAEENETKVRSYQTKYLESLRPETSTLYPYFRMRGNPYYKAQLERLGITVEEIEDNPDVHSESAYPRY